MSKPLSPDAQAVMGAANAASSHGPNDTRPTANDATR
jgi:hypothetical protein